MLKIYNNLIEELNASKIIYCNWKGLSDAENATEGNCDIDLYVSSDSKLEFINILSKKGFIAVSSFQAKHEFIEHFYGLDTDTGIFAHIHVYFRLVTGESFSKNYILPLENFIERHIDNNNLIPKVNPEASMAIFLIRFFIKIGSIYGLLQFFRDKHKYDREWEYINCNQRVIAVPELKLSEEFIKDMYKIFISQRLLPNLFMSIIFKNKINAFKKRGFLRHQFFKGINLIIRILNRFVLKRKKQFKTGQVVAICGLDGTGKSTLVNSLHLCLSDNFCTKKLHLGRPSSTFLSIFFKPFIFLYTKIKRKRNIPSEQILPQGKVSVIYAIRSVLLAYDRKIQADKAFKLSSKGFIVICDRYPGMTIGKMDSPRIYKDSNRSSLYNFLQITEFNLYKKIRLADQIFHLKAPVEIAVERNNSRIKSDKETEEEIRQRYVINSEASFLSDNYSYIDATDSMQHIFLSVLSDVWKKV